MAQHDKVLRLFLIWEKTIAEKGPLVRKRRSKGRIS